MPNRHMTIKQALESERIHQSKELELIDHAYFTAEEHEILFMVYKATYTGEHGFTEIRWKVFENGNPKAGGIIG
jgi:hypothetical protein